jgi:hypothetical protein
MDATLRGRGVTDSKNATAVAAPRSGEDPPHMTSTSYVPILLTKRGELSAATDLPTRVRLELTPLFVVHPIETDFDTHTPSRSAADHVRGLGTKLACAWPESRAYLDPFFVIDMADHTGGLRTIIDEAAVEGLCLVPVVSPGRPDAYTATVAALHKRDHAGVCLRLSPQHWPTTADAVHNLKTLLGAVRVGPQDVDLILDLSDDVCSEFAYASARSAVLNLPYPALWRSVTLAGAAFPHDLSKLAKNSISRIPRRDWRLYRTLVQEAHTAGRRVPTFGDYAVAHPNPKLQVNPRVMNISGSLRYTTDDDFLVAKGTELFKGRGAGAGGEAIRPAVELLAQAREFSGPNFSEGDAWIHRVARRQASCGNPERWRRTATNHHLVFVTDRLASLRAS